MNQPLPDPFIELLMHFGPVNAESILFLRQTNSAPEISMRLLNGEKWVLLRAPGTENLPFGKDWS